MKRLFTALAVALLLAFTASAQVPVSPMPNAKPQFFTNGGVPCVSCTLTTYAGGTTTPLATYTDSTGTVTNPTTITLNSAGYPANQVWLANSTYKLVLKDALGSTIWTVDNVQSLGMFITTSPNTWTAPQTFKVANGIPNCSQYSTLQTCIASLSPAQGEVEIPCGTYTLTSKLTLTSTLNPTHAFKVRGHERSCVIIQLGANLDYAIEMGVYSQLSNVTIIPNGHTATAAINRHSYTVLDHVNVLNTGCGFTHGQDFLGSVAGAFGVFYAEDYQTNIDMQNCASTYGYFYQTTGMPGLTWVNLNRCYSCRGTGSAIAGFYLNGAGFNQFYSIDGENNPGVGFWEEFGGNSVYGGDLENNTQGAMYINPANFQNQSTNIQANSIDSWMQPFSTTGTIALITPTTMTVASGTNFVAGKPITITGAGPAAADLITRVTAVSGTTITIADAATTAVTGTGVAGPTISGTGTYIFQSEQSRFTYNDWRFNGNMRGKMVIYANAGSANAVWDFGGGTVPTTGLAIRDASAVTHFKFNSDGTFALFGGTSGSTALQAAGVASGTLTLPAATDTLIGKATTDTLLGKTFDTAGSGNVLKINSTQVTDKTGTGKVVLDTSPTLATPTLGAATATSITMSGGTAPVVGSPTVGQAACIKAAGPPVQIGYCSNVVGAGGACTCN